MTNDPTKKGNPALDYTRQKGHERVMATARTATAKGPVELNAFKQILHGVVRDDVRRRETEFLEGRFAEIPPNSTFASAMKGVESITLNPATPEKPNELHVRVRVEDRGVMKDVDLVYNPKIKTAPFRPFPPEIARLATADELLKEIVDAAEVLGRVEWYELGGDLIASDTREEPRELSFDASDQTSSPELECPERLAFLTRIPGVKYGFRGQKGFRGYHGIALEDGIYVIDHPEMNNAAYVGDGLPAFTEDKDETTQKMHGLDEATRLFVGRTRKELREMGALVVVHRGNWQERITSTIETIRAKRRARNQAV